MNYQGPGIYKHYKDSIYDVIGKAVREATVRKSGEAEFVCEMCGREYARGEPAASVCGEADRLVFGCRVVRNKPAMEIDVIYSPLSPGSLLEDMDDVEYWSRPLHDFNAMVRKTPVADGSGQFAPVDKLPPLTNDDNVVPRFRKLGLEEILRIRNDCLTEHARFLIHDMIGHT